jgi:hypothetical protein
VLRIRSDAAGPGWQHPNNRRTKQIQDIGTCLGLHTRGPGGSNSRLLWIRLIAYCLAKIYMDSFNFQSVSKRILPKTRLTKSTVKAIMAWPPIESHLKIPGLRSLETQEIAVDWSCRKHQELSLIQSSTFQFHCSYWPSGVRARPDRLFVSSHVPSAKGIPVRMSQANCRFRRSSPKGHPRTVVKSKTAH